MRERRRRAGARVAALAAVLLGATLVAAAPPAPTPAAAVRELAVARRTRELVAEKLTAREADVAARVRALYKLTRAGTTPLWADEGARADLVRRRAAAKRLIVRDLEERALLREELARAEAQEQRLVAEVAAAEAAAPPPLPPGSLRAPVGGRITGRYGAAVDRTTRARTLRRGLAWTTIDGAIVAAPVAGRVMWVGPLRGLGTAVLLDAGTDVTVLVAGPTDLVVLPGQTVAAGERLGVARRGEVVLEVRRAGRTVDPTRLLAR